MKDSSVEPRPIGDLLWFVLPALLFLLFGFAVYVNVFGGGDLPLDFVVFHGAGALFSDGEYSTAYDFEEFSVFLNNNYATSLDDGSLAHFLNPPPFGWLAQVFSVVPIGPSFIAWSVAGILMTITSYVWLDLPKAALPLVLVSPMFVSNIAFGQTGAAALLVTVAVHHFVSNDRKVAAGLAAGLFILKPPLAIGYGLFWLLKSRGFGVSIATALGSGLVLSLPMAFDGLAPWRQFVDTSLERTSLDSDITAGSSFSFAEFLKQFLGEVPSEVTMLVWAVSFATGAAMLAAVDRRYNGNLEMLSATAVIVTVLFSPHILMYDSIIIIIPVAVAHRLGALSSRRAGLLGTVIAVGVTSRLFVGGPSIEFPAMLIAVAALALWVDKAHGPAEDSDLSVRPDPGAVDSERKDLVVGE